MLAHIHIYTLQHTHALTNTDIPLHNTCRMRLTHKTRAHTHPDMHTEQTTHTHISHAQETGTHTHTHIDTCTPNKPNTHSHTHTHTHTHTMLMNKSRGMARLLACLYI